MITVSVAPFASAEDFDVKIAVVNIAAVMEKSTAVKKANDELEAKRNQYQKEITSEEEVLRKSEADLAKQKGILSKEDLSEKQKKFIDQINQARKDVQQRKGKLDKAYREVLVKVRVSVREIVAELAKEKGFNIALPTEPLIFASGDLDITDEVTSRLNSKLPSVALKF